MLRTRNKYCSNCLATQRFLDLGTTLVCERCSKRLDVTPRVAGAGGADAHPEGRLIVWAERSEAQREAS